MMVVSLAVDQTHTGVDQTHTIGLGVDQTHTFLDQTHTIGADGGDDLIWPGSEHDDLMKSGEMPAIELKKEEKPRNLVQSTLWAHFGGKIGISVKGKMIEKLGKTKGRKKRKTKKAETLDGDQTNLGGSRTSKFLSAKKQND